MTGPRVDPAIAALWVQVVPVARARVETLELYAAACAEGRSDAEMRGAAAAAAHRLAGALGSYGRPGSDEAGRLEALLGGGDAPEAAVVLVLVAALRAAVDG